MGTSYVDISTHTSRPECHDGARDGTSTDESGQSSAPDTCGSSACTVDVADANPTAAYPKPLRFRIRCASTCKNGTHYVCTKTGGGQIDFTVAGTCQLQQ